MRFSLLWLILLPVLVSAAQVSVEGGEFRPLFAKPKEPSQSVATFTMDVTPVTNAQFFGFVQRQPQWQREKIARLFADEHYLSHWQINADGIAAPNAQEMDAPVVFVSWYVARAYCAEQQQFLPSTAEWEFAAMADEHQRDARRDPEFLNKILQWYARPMGGKVPSVGQSVANLYGLKDLHGLIWEWTGDFNSVLSTGESRNDAALDNQFFCGAAATGSANPSDYASFMRYALRASLHADYTLGNLGFRCVSH